MHRNRDPLGWKLLQPVAFEDSAAHPAIQLADVIAGTAGRIFTHGAPAGMEAACESIGRHGLAGSLLPDLDIINPANRTAAVNAFILYDLAQRAERGRDPYKGLDVMYRVAEVSWACGDYRLAE